MSIAFIFWFLMLLWLIGWGWGRPWNAAGSYIAWGPNLLLWVLLALLGWKDFGFPIHG